MTESTGGVVVLDERCPVCMMSGWILTADDGGVCLVCNSSLRRHIEGHWEPAAGA